MEKERASRTLKKRELVFLNRELDLWCEEKILTEAQAEAVRGIYAPPKGYFSQMILILGVMLIGLGILSLIAANWMDFPRPMRVALLVGGYLLSTAAAWRIEAENPRMSRALLLLGLFIYGAGIFLSAQMFHSGGEWTDAVAWWIAGSLPAAALFMDEFKLVFLQILTAVYLFGTIDLEILLTSGVSLPLLPIVSILMMLSLWALWQFTEKESAFVFSRSSGICFDFNVFLSLVLAADITLRFCSDDILLFLLSFSAIGLALSFVPFKVRSNELLRWGITITGLSGLMLSFQFVWETSELWQRHTATLSLFAAVLTCIYMLRHVQKGHFSATVFFCLLVLRYYFDRFFSFMPKSLFFIVGGLLLVGMGSALERTRKRHGFVSSFSPPIEGKPFSEQMSLLTDEGLADQSEKINRAKHDDKSDCHANGSDGLDDGSEGRESGVGGDEE